jgi:hypothetical protein
MEIVTYKKHKIYLDTIPKGTLLFRVVPDKEDDFTGVSVGTKKCIPPQYNVFFYFNPFVTESQPRWYESIKTIEVYELEKDVKVVLLLKPSPHTRGDSRYKSKKTKTFMITCNKTRKSCLKGRPYDPCFEDGFIKQFPSVVGYIGVGRNDSLELKAYMKTSLKPVINYIQMAEDTRGVTGSPELVLYPLQHRNTKDILIENTEEWKQSQHFNYKHLQSLPHNQKALVEFVQQHTTRDQITGYYSYKE